MKYWENILSHIKPAHNLLCKNLFLQKIFLRNFDLAKLVLINCDFILWGISKAYSKLFSEFITLDILFHHYVQYFQFYFCISNFCYHSCSCNKWSLEAEAISVSAYEMWTDHSPDSKMHGMSCSYISKTSYPKQGTWLL